METLYLAGMIVAGLFFGWTIGSHYTGAVIGTAYGSKILNLRTAVIIVAIFALLGAILQSHEVIGRIGTGVVPTEYMNPFRGMVIMLTAALVTAVNTWLKLPISTAQLAVFSIVGVGLAVGSPIAWKATMVPLAITWVSTPIAGLIIGFIATKIMGMLTFSDNIKKYILIATCCYASFVLGANNSGLSVTLLYGTGTVESLMKAGFIGGLVVAIGAVTWGRPLLEKVGFHIVQLEINSAIGAQFGMATVCYIAAIYGFPTSLNQSIIGAIAGAGLARGTEYVKAKAINEIVINWFISLIVSGSCAFALYKVLSWVLGVE